MRAFVLQGKVGEEHCQDVQSTPATTPDAPTLQRVGSVSNTRRKRTSVTRSTTVTRLRGDGTEGRGNASVTATQRPTPSVRSVTRRECLYPLKRYTTSYRCPRVEHMTGITSWLCVRVVTQGSMPSEETAGIIMMISEPPIVISPGIDFIISVWNYLADGVGAVRIMKIKATGQRCRPFVRTPCVFERGIKPLIVKKFIGDGQNGKRWNSPRQ